VTDALFLLLIGTSLLLTNVAVYLKVRSFANPIFLISVWFFTPLCFALLRLSGAQANSWTSDTFGVVLETVFCWLLLPAAMLVRLASPNRDSSGHTAFKRPFFVWYARLFAVGYIGAVLLQNYLVSGYALLSLEPELAYEYHATTVPILQIVARSGFAVCGLLFLSYQRRRKVLDLVLLFLVFVAPLTKLARIDLMMAGMTLALLNVYFPVVRVSGRRVIGLLALITLAVYGLVELGRQRVNRFGQYSLSYADAIDFRGYAGPAEMFAVLYGYFPLSFENFDRFVRNNPDERTFGLLSSSPIFNTLFFVNRVTGGKYPNPDLVVDRADPIGAYASTSTALSAFYLDFGAAFSWLPEVIYMLLWVALYLKRARSAAHMFAYCTYSSAMVLSGFQATMAAPVVYQSILLGLAPMLWEKYLDRLRPANLAPTGFGEPAVSS
jgi:hypothetical protein